MTPSLTIRPDQREGLAELGRDRCPQQPLISQRIGAIDELIDGAGQRKAPDLVVRDRVPKRGGETPGTDHQEGRSKYGRSEPSIGAVSPRSLCNRAEAS